MRSVEGLNIYLPVLNPTTGFGYLTTKVLEALDRERILIDNLCPEPFVQESDALSARVQHLISPPLRIVKSHPINFMINVPQFLRTFQGKFNIAYTMFESANVPELFIRSLNRMDSCIVPCVQNKEAFLESGLKVPVRVVEFGNDQKDYHYLERDWEISNSHIFRAPGDEADERELGNPFTFLHIGETNWRKGGDLALKAFKKVFSRDKRDVRICFKFSKGYTPEWYLNALKNVNDDRIHLIKESLSIPELRDLYQWSHCYLGCSRGEGWGFLAWQALATGCPAILTDWGGMAEYAHLAYLLDYTMEYKKAVYYGSEWGSHPEPSLDDLCYHMEWCYNHPEEIAKKGKEAATAIAKDFTWQKTAQKLIRRMEEF